MFGGKAKPDTPTCMTVSWPRVQQSSQCKFLLVDELHEVVEEELVFALSGGVVSLGEGWGESEASPPGLTALNSAEHEHCQKHD